MEDVLAIQTARNACHDSRDTRSFHTRRAKNVQYGNWHLNGALATGRHTNTAPWLPNLAERRTDHTLQPSQHSAMQGVMAKLGSLKWISRRDPWLLPQAIMAPVGEE